jgi:arginine:ornithine antiporter/lysine permease
MKAPSTKLSLNILIAIVAGSMVGGGIFNLPQNMASQGGVPAIIIAWAITGIGMAALCYVYQTLAIRKPDLNNGVYAYARASSGEFIGFCSAWGYWLSAVLGNVSYLTAVFGALGYFFHVFGEGNNLLSFLCASAVLWITHWFVLRGIKGATLLNAFITLAKILPLLLFIILACLAFRYPIFKGNWTPVSLQSLSLGKQIQYSMLVTVWVFIGIEGASVYSARAKTRKDIGRATFCGFLITLFLLVGVSLLSMGILPQAELAELKNLSMAGVMEAMVGPWGAWAMVLGVLLSVGGAFLAWTLLATESIVMPAKEGLMPSYLAQENSKEIPVHALWMTNAFTQLFLILALFSQATYLALISLATAMILIPYLFSAVYALQIIPFRRLLEKSIIIIAMLYCFWLLYAAEIYLLLSIILYIPGIIFYIIYKNRRKNSLNKIPRTNILA